ncbi:MAG: MarR family transcriptional regulator [Clostridiales bacterium]|nr:MarR family transcriptional regulator [Clostridiales bacterium]
MIELTQFKTASLLVKLGNAVTYFRNKKMESIDLTSVQSDAFIDIIRNPGITASQMKDHIQLSQSTVAGLIARLESKHLISKTVDDRDARKVFLNPTQQGLLLEETLKEIAFETQQVLVNGMNESEQAEFARLLEIALNNLNRARSN